MGDEYDVCILGAGIAGATLASNLAPELDVCMVDRKPLEEIGDKPCGNAVHRSWIEQNRMGNDLDEYGAVAKVSKKAKVHLSGGDLEADLPEDREMFILDRDLLIDGFVTDALDDGADLFTESARPRISGGSVQEVGVNGSSVTAGTYVDSSGTGAVLRSKFEPTPEDSFFTGYREVVEGELRDDACHVFYPGSNYALWAFPMGDRTNVGGGLLWGNGIDLKEEVGDLRKELGLDGEVLNSGFGPIPSPKPIDLVHGNSVAIGDAGLTVNPLTGGGIGPSMKAASMLTETILGGDDLEDFEEEYMERIGEGYEKNYHLNRTLLKLQKVMPERISRWAFSNFYGGEPVEG